MCTLTPLLLSTPERPPQRRKQRGLLLKCRKRTSEPPLLSGSAVTSLSVPKPAFTNPLTKVEARFWRAESTEGPSAARPSIRWLLYTSSGVLACTVQCAHDEIRFAVEGGGGDFLVSQNCISRSALAPYLKHGEMGKNAFNQESRWKRMSSWKRET